MENILIKIRSLREKHGFTLKKLAKVTGYRSAKGYRDLENGNVKLTVEHLKSLAEFYNISICYFFENEITEKVFLTKESSSVA
ncbi:helix-turn-helix domain-containing protein [Anaeroarcus burkinensis]|uniref:helix-turn-helix domain-containing protein n=1 Tax=Anaeroarcus burkinensis TaxID=82376 RepID=UPI0004144E10|nr:helix-turn-helix transcriptional regulator [Anaeroarcus burkinensis]